ncbi:acyl carrier protein [Streptomyces misionensis]|uniref:acyl carrier protein n=1 Tax=Streptomyces misionensis TaxID=67331 RepID=UPI0036AD0FD0
MPEPTARVQPDEIRRWLTERAAYYLECPVEELDPGVPLAELGLDSVYALTLCGDVEDRYGLVLEPSAAWDHPSLDALTAHLLAALERV